MGVAFTMWTPRPSIPTGFLIFLLYLSPAASSPTLFVLNNGSIFPANHQLGEMPNTFGDSLSDTVNQLGEMPNTFGDSLSDTVNQLGKMPSTVGDVLNETV